MNRSISEGRNNMGPYCILLTNALERNTKIGRAHDVDEAFIFDNVARLLLCDVLLTSYYLLLQLPVLPVVPGSSTVFHSRTSLRWKKLCRAGCSAS
jgi:hypothetical protein